MTKGTATKLVRKLVAKAKTEIAIHYGRQRPRQRERLLKMLAAPIDLEGDNAHGAMMKLAAAVCRTVGASSVYIDLIKDGMDNVRWLNKTAPDYKACVADIYIDTKRSLHELVELCTLPPLGKDVHSNGLCVAGRMDNNFGNMYRYELRRDITEEVTTPLSDALVELAFADRAP